MLLYPAALGAVIAAVAAGEVLVRSTPPARVEFLHARVVAAGGLRVVGRDEVVAALGAADFFQDLVEVQLLVQGSHGVGFFQHYLFLVGEGL
jgi:hypothetical protein